MKKALMILFAIIVLAGTNAFAQPICDPTLEVTLSSAPPVCQCAYLCQGVTTTIQICGTPGADFPPIVTITPGCYTVDRVIEGCEDEFCEPAEYEFDPTLWNFNPTTGCWINVIIPLSNGCVCVCFDDYLPVELSSFTAIPAAQTIELQWITASELNNDYFELLRDGVTLTQINSQGDGATGHTYTYRDDRVSAGVAYDYTLISVSLNGMRQEIGTVSATPSANSFAAADYALYQNYPNPFNPMTTIAFDLKEAGLVSLKIYNPNGQLITTLMNGMMEAGSKTVQFNGANLPSGVYWYLLEVNGFSAARKMVLLK